MDDPSKKPDETVPIGINFDEFSKNNSNDNVGKSEDDPIIKELSAPHSKIKKILTNRMNSLKQLSNVWLKGDISETIRELSLIKDQGVSCDFFNSAFMQNGYNKDYLKLDESVSLIPLVLTLVESKYESNFRCGVKMVYMLFDMYSDSIRAIKRSQKIEVKTMENYTQFFDIIPKIENIVKRDLNKDKNLKALLGEMKVFVEDCMNKVFQIIIIYYLKYF